jgi:very-short-patch-repair endonuclease
MNSKELSLKLNKDHYNVKRDIFRLIERNSELKKEIKIGSYTVRGKKYENILLSEKILSILKQKYKLRYASSSIEKEYLKIICDIFPNEKKEFQKNFLNGKYKVDLFFTDLSMVIEIYEKEHEHKKEYDFKRKEEIKKEMFEKIKNENLHINGKSFNYNNFTSFIIIKEGFLGEGIREILLEMQKITQSDIIKFIK